MLIAERLGSSLLERDGVLGSTQTLPLPGICLLRFVYHWHELHFKQANAKIITPHLPGSHNHHLEKKFFLPHVKTKHG